MKRTQSEYPCLSCSLLGKCRGRIKGCQNYTGVNGTVSADDPKGPYSVEQTDAEICA